MGQRPRRLGRAAGGAEGDQPEQGEGRCLVPWGTQLAAGHAPGQDGGTAMGTRARPMQDYETLSGPSCVQVTVTFAPHSPFSMTWGWMGCELSTLLRFFWAIVCTPSPGPLRASVTQCHGIETLTQRPTRLWDAVSQNRKLQLFAFASASAA